MSLNELIPPLHQSSSSSSPQRLVVRFFVMGGGESRRLRLDAAEGTWAFRMCSGKSSSRSFLLEWKYNCPIMRDHERKRSKLRTEPGRLHLVWEGAVNANTDPGLGGVNSLCAPCGVNFCSEAMGTPQMRVQRPMGGERDWIQSRAPQQHASPAGRHASPGQQQESG